MPLSSACSARDNRDAITTSEGFNGSFLFPSITAYVATLNGMAQGLTIAQIAAACPVTGACTPNRLNYTTGNQKFLANVFDAGLFFQDDWKVNRFLTLSGGLRYETQNHCDHTDFGPRFAFAYAVDGHKKGTQTKTVVRAGFGFFYDRFRNESLMTLEQANGGPNSQHQITIANPTCYSETSLKDALSNSGSNAGSNCNSGSSTIPQTYTIAPDYHSPYSQQFGATVERQLGRAATFTLTYLHTYGVHQLTTRNANAYLPGTFQYGSPTLTGIRPTPPEGIVREYYPQGVFKQNQFVMNANARLTPSFSLMGFYTLNFANGNTTSFNGTGGMVSNSYNLHQDYGPSPFARRNMVFVMGNYSGKWGLSYNPFLVVQSGRPYNVTTNLDLTGDNFFNSRPSYAANSTSCSGNPQYVQTQYGCLNIIPQPGEYLVPTYMGPSPTSVAFNLRVSRSFGLGPEISPPGGQNRGGGRGNRGGGPEGQGGGPGGPAGSVALAWVVAQAVVVGAAGVVVAVVAWAADSAAEVAVQRPTAGRKYSLTFSAQALNLFNNINYGTPSGSVVPTLESGSGPNAVFGPGSRFNKSTSLAGGMFASPLDQQQGASISWLRSRLKSELAETTKAGAQYSGLFY